MSVWKSLDLVLLSFLEVMTLAIEGRRARPLLWLLYVLSLFKTSYTLRIVFNFFFFLCVPEFLLSQETNLPGFSFSTSFQDWFFFAHIEHESCLLSLYWPDLAPLICLCLQLTHPRGQISNPRNHFTISLTTEASQHDATFGTVGSFAFFQIVTLGPFP